MSEDDVWICTHTRKCGWLGLSSELASVRIQDSVGIAWQQTCPVCGNEEFYVRRSVTVPPRDLMEFAALPETVRTEVQRWMSALTPVQTGKLLGPAINKAAKTLGVAERTVRRKWNLTQDKGWRGLID